MFRFHSFIFLLGLCLTVSAHVLRGDKNCSCGFYDTNTEKLFTDSIIVYFNESSSLPDDFVAEDYQHNYEKDWNSLYRLAADPSNLQFNDAESLELFVSPPTSDRIVSGAGIRTARRDIQHGSFRTFIKPPRNTFRGSAMSMMWKYNETEVTELSVMNANDTSQAWIGTFVGNEFSAVDLGANCSIDLNETAVNQNYTALGGNLGNGSLDPREYIEYRIDWTKDFISFYVGGNLMRTVLQMKNQSIPLLPAPFYFKHWWSHNGCSLEGPPGKQSAASIGWIRMFFNSSSMSEDARENFVARCPITDACSMDDISLRGSTPFSEDATEQWKQDKTEIMKRMPALWISVICISCSSLLLLHAFLRRVLWRKQPKSIGQDLAPTEPIEKADPNPFDDPEHTLPSQDNLVPASPIARQPSLDYGYDSRDDLAIEKAEPSPDTSVCGGSTHGASSREDSVRFDSRGTTPRILSPYSSNFNTTTEELPISQRSQARLGNSSRTSERTIAVSQAVGPADKIQMETVTESALPAPRMVAHSPPPRERIDYLAGLVALCAILVTVMHFGLTFVPGMVIPGAPLHYQSEYWAQKIVAPFILNQMWLGVFFTTSVRFLVAGYLKRGDMQDIARAAVRRTPRLMIPVASIALLEYFLVDCGTTKYLSYISSLTWSTWPYVARFPTIGHFISEVLELIYLIPNAVPQITFNYCTGVLWTIAVQLQGSWLVLCGVVVIYEIKTPWKRMGYYIFCLLNHWYAQSWGSYLWLGLLLTDLDVTYKYRPWLHARPFIYYPLIIISCLCIAAGFATNIVSNWTDFNFATYEHNIHPDIASGEPVWNTVNAGYPAYYVPRLNGLLFAGGMQVVVELSPAVQYVLSLPFLLIIFPHIFTIYLIHGLVFWSWGSWLMIFLADRSFSYGINVTIVGITSYILLFATLPIVTPVVEALGKDVTLLVWTVATEESPARRRTLFPFPDDLFARRFGKKDVEATDTTETRSVISGSGRTTPSDKGKTKEKVKEIIHDGFDSKGKVQVQSSCES